MLALKPGLQPVPPAAYLHWALQLGCSQAAVTTRQQWFFMSTTSSMGSSITDFCHVGGLSLLGSFRGSFPCCRWAELQQLAPTESASSLHCSVVARIRAHLYIVGCTQSRVSSSILRQAYLLAVCIWSNVEPPLLDRSLHADLRYLHSIIAKVITRHLGCSSPILGGERSSDGRQYLWAGERGRRVIQEPEDIGPSHGTTSTIKSHKPLCCIVLCGAGHYWTAFYAAGLRAAGLGRVASQAEVCQSSDRKFDLDQCHPPRGPALLEASGDLTDQLH